MLIMLVTTECTKKKKHDNVRIKRIVKLDSHDVIVDSKKVVLFDYEQPLLS